MRDGDGVDIGSISDNNAAACRFSDLHKKEARRGFVFHNFIEILQCDIEV